jgi:hypothetical protein
VQRHAGRKGGWLGNERCSNPSAEIFTEYVEWHRELRDRLGDTHAIVVGDFNLKLDVKQNYKSRSTAIIRNFMEECGLEDAGGDEDAYMEAPTPPQKP